MNEIITDKIGYEYGVSRMASIGEGSDRTVYDLKNGTVLKLAKTARGMGQNANERNDMFISSFIPRVHEIGLDYVIVEKVPRDDTVTKKFLKPLQAFYESDFKRKNVDLSDTLKTMGLIKLLEYSALFSDIKREENWGVKDGVCKLIDLGSIDDDFMSSSVQESYRANWELILDKRMRFKRDENIGRFNVVTRLKKLAMC